MWNDDTPITWEGWWEEAEKEQCPEPWETFELKVFGREAGDYRNATVEDLRPAGFVPVAEVRQLEVAIVALDAILFHADDHPGSEKAKMRSQLVNDLAKAMERRGWAGAALENRATIQAAVRRVQGGR